MVRSDAQLGYEGQHSAIDHPAKDHEAKVATGGGVKEQEREAQHERGPHVAQGEEVHTQQQHKRPENKKAVFDAPTQARHLAEVFGIGGEIARKIQQHQILGDFAGLKRKQPHVEVYFYAAALGACAKYGHEGSQYQGSDEPGVTNLIDDRLLPPSQHIKAAGAVPAAQR